MDMSFPKMRKDLSIPGLLEKARRTFGKITDPLQTNRPRLPLPDCLMAGLALFSLKFPSLLQFDQSLNDEEQIKHNLQALYGLDRVPCDTYLRERLDEVSPEELRKPFKSIFTALQRGKALEGFDYMNGHYLLSIDGTGYFSSYDVHCDNCCVKNHRNGKTSYYHQMLGAVLVNPNKKEVLPFPPEPILKQDGVKKNDCERNAAKRLLKHIRREHPHLKLIVVEDGLASNGPHITLLKELNMRFILGAKPSDHKFLFDWVDKSKTMHHEIKDPDGTIHRFRFINGVPLNDTCFDLEVNFLEYWEISPAGVVKQHFSWVTDLLLTKSTVYSIMKGGRARWKIENETFNTLKNQGYHFEHNFGHGNKNLSTVFAYLMMLAFLIDQVQTLCCQLFNAAMAAAKSKKRFWERVRGIFTNYFVQTWEDLYLFIAGHLKGAILNPDTS